MNEKDIKKNIGTFTKLQINSVNNIIIIGDNGELMYSYNTPICARIHSWNNRKFIKESIYINTLAYETSNTTMKHLSKYLGHNIKVTRKKIETGEYKTFKEREDSI